MLGVLDTGDGYYRPKYFTAHDFIVLPGAGYYGRLVKEAFGPGSTSARGDFRVGKLAGAVDEAGHTVALPGRNERAHLNAGFLLGAHLDGRHGATQVGHQSLVYLFTRIHAAGRRAVLPSVVIAKGTQAFHHAGEISIVQNNHGSLATQFQVGSLDAACSGFHDLAASRHIACQ